VLLLLLMKLAGRLSSRRMRIWSQRFTADRLCILWTRWAAVIDIPHTLCGIALRRTSCDQADFLHGHQRRTFTCYVQRFNLDAPRTRSSPHAPPLLALLSGLSHKGDRWRHAVLQAGGAPTCSRMRDNGVSISRRRRSVASAPRSCLHPHPRRRLDATMLRNSLKKRGNGLSIVPSQFPAKFAR
jgi:hypothetical protein